MISFDFRRLSIQFFLLDKTRKGLVAFWEHNSFVILAVFLSLISILSFIFYSSSGLSLAYNDARSHLNIGRRVVENLKPGFSQLGSVWLPLPHLLMLFTVWNDFMWHTGLSGALQSMICFVITGLLVYLFLRRLQVGLFARVVGILFFVLNMNVLYMQSTAMTEFLLLATMTAGVYALMMWYKDESIVRLLEAALWIMLSTLIRYNGWFLLLFAFALIVIHSFRKHGFKTAEGTGIFFMTFAGFGIFVWLFWNLMIFKDPFYFAFGPYSAHSQQLIMEQAGALPTKHDVLLSFKVYWHAIIYVAGFFSIFISTMGMLLFVFDKRISSNLKIGISPLLAPFFFNVLALYLGHSVLYVEDLSGSWFNVRYGLMVMPAVAVFGAYFVHRIKSLRYVVVGLFLFVFLFSFVNRDAVTIDDALVGASGKNVKEVSGWLHDRALHEKGFVLISVASHDAIIFSSGLPMSRFIHEGTGIYWDLATVHPSRFARWIILRTNDESDSTFRIIGKSREFKSRYTLVHAYPFADIYELKSEYLRGLHSEANLKQVD